MESWQLGGEAPAAHICDSKTSVRETWEPLTMSPGRDSQLTDQDGEILWTNTSSQEKRSWWSKRQANAHAKRSATTLTDWIPSTDVTTATEIATPASVSTATRNAAPAELTAGTRMPYPWSTNDRRRPTTNAPNYHLSLVLAWVVQGDAVNCNPRNQLETPGGAKSFQGGAQIF